MIISMVLPDVSLRGTHFDQRNFLYYGTYIVCVMFQVRLPTNKDITPNTVLWCWTLFPLCRAVFLNRDAVYILKKARVSDYTVLMQRQKMLSLPIMFLSLF